MTREDLLIALSARILALPEDQPQAVAIDGMSGVGKSTLARELTAVIEGAGRPVVPVAYHDFHFPRERRHRRGRLSAEGYLEDAFDPALLRRHVLAPLSAGGPSVRPAAYDLPADEPALADPIDLGGGSIVLADGSFLLAAELAGSWDLSVLVVADPATVLERVLVRDADLGTPEQVRELYLRRYFGAWALYEERADPWSRADLAVDLTDPLSPVVVGADVR